MEIEEIHWHAVISSLGEDVKQSDETYRFCAHANVLLFFTFLHTKVDSILNPHNIQREKSNILKYCLEQISLIKSIHVQYSHLLAGATGGYTCHKWFEKYSHLLAGATGG